MKKKLVTLLIGVSLVLALVTVPFMTACAPKAPEVKTVKFGYLAPLSGPAAMWGIAPLSGLNIWIDKVNAAGGMDVGGEKYKVEVVQYDDEYTGTKALLGAKKLVLEDDVKMTIVMSGAPATATAPFLTEHKILSFCDCLEARAGRPYFLAAGANWPFIDAVMLEYYADKYGDKIKRVALACQDDVLGYYSTAITEASCEVNGWDLVYEKLFSTTTVDFAPVMSAILATEPDLIALGGIWGDFRASLIEQAYLQGAPSDILWQASEWLLAVDLAGVPEDFLEGAVGSFPFCNDPILPESSHEFWDAWHARYGPGAPEDLHRDFCSSDWYSYNYGNLWQQGVEKAGTFDAAAVVDALLSIEEPFHVFGAKGWWGEEMYGVSHSLAITEYITEVHNGKHVGIARYLFKDWFEVNATPLVKAFLEHGLMWWQQ